MPPDGSQPPAAQPTQQASIQYQPDPTAPPPPVYAPDPTAAQSPQEYWDNLYKAAGAKYGVHPALVKAVREQESGDKQYVVSSAGAEGPMQFMPGTAKQEGVKDPYNSEDAVFGAAKLLRENFDQYKDPRQALMVYNAGGDPSKWVPGYADGVMARFNKYAPGMRPGPKMSDHPARDDQDDAIPPPPPGLVPKSALRAIPPPPPGLVPISQEPSLTTAAHVAEEQQQGAPPSQGLFTAAKNAANQAAFTGVGAAVKGVGEAIDNAAVNYYRRQLATMDLIDQGKPPTEGGERPLYADVSPEQRQQMRADIQAKLDAATAGRPAPPPTRAEPADMTDRYNTPLSDADEAKFQQWMKDRSKFAGRDTSSDLFDYDLRGAWKANAEQASNGHLPDTFKKPNHPTFSDESQYNGADGHVGGQWVPSKDGPVFQASPTNVQNMGTQGLRDYFKKVEPTAALALPPTTGGADNAITRAGQAIQNYGTREYPVQPQNEGVVTGAARMIGGLVPMAAAAGAGAVVGGPVGAVELGGAVFGGTFAAAQSYDGTYNEALSKGASYDEAHKAATESAATNGVMMAAPIGRLFSGVPAPVKEGFAQTLVNLGKHGVEFGSVGAASQFADNYIANQTYDPTRPLLKDVPSAFGEGFVTGLVVPAATGVTKWSADKLRDAMSQPASDAFRQAADDLQQEAVRRRAAAQPKQITGPETPPPESPAAEAPPAGPTPPAAPPGESPPAPAGSPEAPLPAAKPEAEKPATADKPVPIEKPGDIEAATQHVEQPTPAQAEAGNYQKAHVEIAPDAPSGGLSVTVETPKGVTRSGVGPDGKPWSVEAPADYGEIKGTKGADGDPLDVYLGPLAHEAQDHPVYIVQQHEPGKEVGKPGDFDEHKPMVGFPSEAEAVTTYLQGFSDNSGPSRIGQVVPMPFDQFVQWAHSDAAAQPFPKAEAAKIEAPSQGGGEAPAETAETETPTSSEAAAPSTEGAQASTRAPKSSTRRRVSSPETLLQFLAARGGLKDQGGELASMGLTKRFVPGHGALVRPTGMTLDRAREAAQEAGFLPPDSPNRPSDNSIDDLIGLLDQEARGQKVYRPSDIVEAQARAAERERMNPGNEEGLAVEYAMGEVQSAADDMGLTLTAEETEDIARAVVQGTDVLTAITNLTEEKAVEAERAAAEAAKIRDEQDWDIPWEWPSNVEKPQGGDWPGEPASTASEAAAEPDTAAAAGDGAAGDESRAGEHEGAQTLIPGVGPVTDKDRAQAGADRPLKGGNAPIGDVGLFSPAAGKQTDLVDAVNQAKAEAAKPVEPPKNGMEYAAAKHTKTGVPLHVVKLTGERLTPEAFNALRAKAKTAGGSWSSFRGKGAVPGFQFKTKAAAEKFIAENGGAAPEAATPEEVPPPPPGFVPASKMNETAFRSALERTGAAQHDGLWRIVPDVGSGYAVEYTPPNGRRETFRASENRDPYNLDEARQRAVQEAEAVRQFGAEAPRPLSDGKGGNLTEVGKNYAGETLYEDKHGVRSIHDKGVSVGETVDLRPERTPNGGIRYVPQVMRGQNKEPRFQIAEPHPASGREREYQAPQESDADRRERERLERWNAAEDARKKAEAAEQPQAEEPGYGAGNKTFTADKAEAARARLREKLKRLNSGLDPEMMLDGLTLAGYHIEAGARVFADYARAMVDDLGQAATPFLRSWYEAVRHYPGFDHAGMSGGDEIEAALRDIDRAPTSPEEADHGLQNPLPESNAGARPEDVPATEPGGAVGSPRPGEGGRGEQDAGRYPEGGEEGAVGPAGEPGGAEGSGGAGVRDADRLPDTGEGSKPRTARRPPRPDAHVTGTDYRIEPGEIAEDRGPAQKARDNLDAIRIVKQMALEGRLATREEQGILARYVGWGGLPKVFDRNTDDKTMKEVGDQIRTLLTPDEYQTASRSTQCAHYTAENVVRAMWDAVQRMGFKGGLIFEPGMGIGNFLGMMPPDLAEASKYQGVEMDHLTADIAKALYPESGIRRADLRKVPLPKDHFDLAIGNPPFSGVTITSDPKYRQGFVLADYFFAKSLDSVRPGGLLAFVTGAGTMTKLGSEAREYLAERGEFLGGIGLPSDAFKQNAGTEVTTHILFFKKRPEQVPFDSLPASERAWTEVTPKRLPNAYGGTDEGNVSRYFDAHPDMVLGEEGFFDKLHPGRYAVHSDGRDLTQALGDAIAKLPADVMTPLLTPEQRGELDFGSGQTKDGSFYLKGDRLMQYSGGVGRVVPMRGAGVAGPSAEEHKIIKHLIPVRDAMRDVIAADIAGDEEAGKTARKALNKHYDAFVKQHGPINKANIRRQRPSIIQQESARLAAREDARAIGEYFSDGDFNVEPYLRKKAKIAEIANARRDAREAALAAGKPWDEGTFDPGDMPDIVIDQRPNIRPFMADPESYRLRSIEDYDDATGTAKKRDVFYRSVIKRSVEPDLKTAKDGVIWSMNEFGKFDLGKIAAKMNLSPETVLADLGDHVYRLPGTSVHQTREEYLSGDVKTKLQEARAAALADPTLERNVKALEAVQPRPLAPNQISMVLGMPWMGAETVNDFIDHLGIGRFEATHVPEMGRWLVTDAAAYSGYRPKKKQRRSQSQMTEGALRWGIPQRSAAELLTDALNRTPPRVMTEGSRDDPPRFDPVATEAAQAKITEMKEAFASWLDADGDRKNALADLYNDKMNRTVAPVIDGSYLTLPGVADHWKWRPHQLRAIARVIQKGNTYLAHAVGAGKAQPLDAKVLTPDGWRLMGDLAVGDFVIAGDGSPTRVEGVFPQGEKDIFRITFSDGASTQCCDEHLWLTRTYRERGYAQKAARAGKDWNCGKPKARSLAEIRTTLRSDHLNAANHSIPMVGAVQFNAASLPLDPYLMGLLIGDGCFRSGVVMFSCAEAELVEAVQALLPPECEIRLKGRYDYHIRFTGTVKYAVGGGRVPTHPVINALRAGGMWDCLSNEKTIPDAYLFGDVESRVALLQGLLDTDGTVSRSGHGVSFTTVSPSLARRMTELVRSLGGTTGVNLRFPTYTHAGVRHIGQQAYTLSICLPPHIAPFRLSRKAAIAKPKTKYVPTRYIVDVEPVGRKEAQCIRVAHPSHLYVTDDFIVTHNTTEMIASAMEMRRLGLVRKPMFAVPNHMLAQFTKEFYELYPTARISVADEEKFHTDRRKQFIANVAQDDLDAVIITHSSFGMIPISHEYENGIIQEEIENIREAMSGLSKQDDRITIKNLEKMLEKLQEKMARASGGAKDQAYAFEELGVDFLYVDEAHLFRKLSFATALGNIKGITPSGSEMAWDLYTKMRYLNDERPGRSAVLASGTPITNTMGELYTVSRYLQPQALKERGIQHFDSWAQTFGDTTTDLEPRPDGSYKPATRFSKFVNTPELYQIVSEVMDTVTSEQLAQYVVRPQLEGGKRHLHLAPFTEHLQAYQKTLADRLKDIEARTGSPKKGDDILLTVINDGRHSAIDPRFVMEAQNDPKSKLNMMIDNVARIWKESANQQFYDPGTSYKEKSFRGPATQMIFSNLGVNGRGPMGFSGYAWIRAALERQGIPSHEIAFIGDYKGSLQRQQLFNDVNEGKVRILVGSTQKMGTGVNAQKRLLAIHNLDPLWYPSDDEQRNGRGLRQGNHNPFLQIHDYTTTDTYDRNMWTMMGRKAGFIESFFRGDPDLREMEDLGEASVFAQAAAMATSDPRVFQMADIKAQLDKAERRRDAYENNLYSLRGQFNDARYSIEYAQKRIAQTDEDIAQRIPTKGDAFRMNVAGKEFDKRQDAWEELQAVMKDRLDGMGETGRTRIGIIGGFGMVLSKTKLGYRMALEAKSGREIDISATGPIASAESYLRDLEKMRAGYERDVEEKQKQAELLRAELEKPFEGDAEIKRLRQSYNELRTALTPKKEAGMNVGEDEDEESRRAPVTAEDAKDRGVTQDEPALREAMREAMRLSGLPSSIGVRLVDKLAGGKVDSVYARNLITVALDTPPEQLPAKLFHETIHAMMDPSLNILSTQQRTALLVAANRYLADPAKKDALDRLYGTTKDGKTDRVRLNNEAIAVLAEQALAHARSEPGPVTRAADAMVRTVTGIRQALRGQGFLTADDVFRTIMQGKVVPPATPGLPASRPTGGTEARPGAPSVKAPVAKAPESPKALVVDQDIEPMVASAATVAAEAGPRPKPPIIDGSTMALSQMGIWHTFADGVQKIFSPSTRHGATDMAQLLRKTAGEQARSEAMFRYALQDADWQVNRLGHNAQIALAYDFEDGLAMPTPELQTGMNALRKELDDMRDRIRALGEGYIEAAIENYSAHYYSNYKEWKAGQMADAESERVGKGIAAAQNRGKGPMLGSRTFLKQRTFDHLRDAMAAGLKPVTTNVVRMNLLKLQEMNKFYHGLLAVEAIKALPLTKWVPINDYKRATSGGLVELNDSAFMPMLPPAVATHYQSFDPSLRQGIYDLAKFLGVQVKNPRSDAVLRANPKWGGYWQDGKIVAKFGSADIVLMHEIGHQLDKRYDLQDRMLSAHGAWGELGRLALMRKPAADMTEEMREYLLSPDERIANMFHAYWHSPEMFAAVAPAAAEAFGKFLADNPDVAEKIEAVKPSLKVESQTTDEFFPGMREVGKWFAYEPPARVFNNFVSTGLSGHPIYEGLRIASNAVNMLQLSLSAFHATFIGMEATVSQLAHGVEQAAHGVGRLAHGDIRAAGSDAVAAAKSVALTPIASVRTPWRGRQMLAAFRNPDGSSPLLVKIADLYAKGGGRDRMDRSYGLGQHGPLVKSWRDVVRAATAHPAGTLQAIANDCRDMYGETPGPAVIKLLSVPLKMAGRILETFNHPIMGALVPWAKAGFFRAQMEDFIRRNPAASEHELIAEAQRIVDSGDNRYGELVRDNLAWSKVAKDISMLSQRSDTWNLGSLREIGGGAFVDTPKFFFNLATRQQAQFTRRMAYIPAALIVYALAGALFSYMVAGEWPQDLRDYFYPKTGRKNEYGEDERISIPGYLKDVVNLYMDPVRTVTGKGNPFIQMMGEMLHNRDYRDHIIYDSDHETRAGAYFRYLTGELTPIGLRSRLAHDQGGPSMADYVKQFIGLSPAPFAITAPDAAARLQHQSDEKSYRARERARARDQ
jgi:N12 class adenine-specific DNA methylase